MPARFVNELGAPAADPTATMQSFVAPAGGSTTRTGIDVSGYQSVIVTTELAADGDSFLTEVNFTERAAEWYADPQRVTAQICTGAGSRDAFAGGLNTYECSRMVIPITGKYMNIRCGEFTAFGGSAANPAEVTYVLSPRAVPAVQAFNAGRQTLTSNSTATYVPGTNTFFWSGTVGIAGSPTDSLTAWPPCGAGFAELTVRTANSAAAEMSYGLADATLAASSAGGQLAGVLRKSQAYTIDRFQANHIGRRPIRLYIVNYSAVNTIPFVMTLTWEAQ